MPEIDLTDHFKDKMEFEIKMNGVISAYLRDPSRENAVAVREIGRELFRRSPGIASIGPLLGLWDGVEELNPKIHERWRFNTSRRILGFLLPKWRPGWNDYWMARWMVTHSPAALEEIHKRLHITTPLDGLSAVEISRRYMVWSSARWMVNSYRQGDGIFDVDMKRLEESCPICSRGGWSPEQGPPVWPLRVG